MIGAQRLPPPAWQMFTAYAGYSTSSTMKTYVSTTEYIDLFVFYVELIMLSPAYDKHVCQWGYQTLHVTHSEID